MKVFPPAVPFTVPGVKQAPYRVVWPRESHHDRMVLRHTVPMTIAPPISGELVHTADNRPEDPANWQNEPGPGVGETAREEVIRRDIAPMERIPRVVLPHRAA